CCDLSGTNQAAGKLKQLLVQRPEKMSRLEEVRDAVKRLVVDEDRAEKRLFHVDVVWRRAKRGHRFGKLFADRRFNGHGDWKTSITVDRMGQLRCNTRSKRSTKRILAMTACDAVTHFKQPARDDPSGSR